MIRFSKYKVAHRRRREGRTDYRFRLKLLKSKKPRFVVRKFNKNISCQIIEYNPKGDKTIVSAHSRELKNLGWSHNAGNLPAAYLTGLLCGLRAKDKKIKEAVFDAGLYTSTKGSKLYAALKGFLDAGVAIPHSSEILPDEKRIKGEHITEERRPKIFQEVKEKILKHKSA